MRQGRRGLPREQLLVAALRCRKTERDAIAGAKQALDEMVITGVPSVLPFHRAVVRNAEFTRDDAYGVYTTWIEAEFAEDLASSPEIAAAQPGAERETLTIEIEGKAMNIGLPASLVDSIRHGGHGAAMEAAADNVEAADSTATLNAPMNGNLVKWVAEDGAVVAA